MTITRTLAEITAKCTKAARGAGCPWGLAEEAGMAARVLESHGLPGVAMLAHLLTSPRDCACAGFSGGATCGVAALASVSDRVNALKAGEVIAFDKVVAPILLAAPLLMAARSGGGAFMVEWDGAGFLCMGGGVVADAPATQASTATNLRVSMVTAGADTPVPADAGSRKIDKTHWATLDRLAFETLVPETEESRARGAGPS